MTTEVKHGLYRKQALSQAYLAEIRQLADICNQYENISLKLNWDTLASRSQNLTNDFLYYEQGQLVGFLALFSFSQKEAEVTGMVHPAYRRQGTFRALFNTAKAECQRRGLPRLILIIESGSPAGKAFAEAVGAQYGYSEYKMVLGTFNPPAARNEQLEFRPARKEDAETIAHITALSFNLPEDDIDWYTERIASENHRRFYVGILNGLIIGKIDVTIDQYEAMIYGFGVLPEYQGKGHGRQILARTIETIRAEGQQQIALEVDTENANAYKLYLTTGFKEVARYDYYELGI